MQISTIELILEYLHIKNPHRESFSSGEIHRAATEAQHFWWNALPPEFFESIDRIITKHGFTKETWHEAMLRATHWAGFTTIEAEACNEEIKPIARAHKLINSTPQLPNYTTQLLHQTQDRKTKKVLRTGERGKYKYSLINKPN